MKGIRNHIIQCGHHYCRQMDGNRPFECLREIVDISGQEAEQRDGSKESALRLGHLICFELVAVFTQGYERPVIGIPRLIPRGVEPMVDVQGVVARVTPLTAPVVPLQNLQPTTLPPRILQLLGVCHSAANSWSSTRRIHPDTLRSSRRAACLTCSANSGGTTACNVTVASFSLGSISF